MQNSEWMYRAVDSQLTARRPNLQVRKRLFLVSKAVLSGIIHADPQLRF